jgi:hypothetical protein
MKTANIDEFVLIYYSNCFVCKRVMIYKLMFLDILNTETEKLIWAITLLLKAPSWKWMRTGNCKCQRICTECVQKKKEMTKLVLNRGYFSVSPIQPRPKTIPDLVEMLDMGRLERL